MRSRYMIPALLAVACAAITFGCLETRSSLLRADELQLDRLAGRQSPQAVAAAPQLDVSPLAKRSAETCCQCDNCGCVNCECAATLAKAKPKPAPTSPPPAPSMVATKHDVPIAMKGQRYAWQQVCTRRGCTWQYLPIP